MQALHDLRRFVEQEIPCATVEGLTLLKLDALPSLYRLGNFTRVGLYENDIATLMHTHNLNVESLLDELKGHLDHNDMAQVEQIVGEIRERIRQFEKRN